jgi:CYTH domain-containing protein
MGAQTLESGEGREIERVWVLRAMPTIPPEVRTEVWQIDQGYLAPIASSETALAALGFPEGRLRRVVEPSGRERFFHTVKSGAGMVRLETEREITSAEFASAWLRTEGRRLVKTRHRVHLGVGAMARVWEIDRFRDLPLVMVEVELPSEHAACDMPSWIESLVEREVTFDARYRNAALAMTGVPKH